MTEGGLARRDIALRVSPIHATVKPCIDDANAPPHSPPPLSNNMSNDPSNSWHRDERRRLQDSRSPHRALSTWAATHRASVNVKDMESSVANPSMMLKASLTINRAKRHDTHKTINQAHDEQLQKHQLVEHAVRIHRKKLSHTIHFNNRFTESLLDPLPEVAPMEKGGLEKWLGRARAPIPHSASVPCCVRKKLSCGAMNTHETFVPVHKPLTPFNVQLHMDVSSAINV